MSAVASLPGHVTGELSVLVRLHELVASIPARWITRLVLPSEVSLLTAGAPDVVEFAGTRHAAWDLGALLEIPPLVGAWLLMRVPHRGRVMPIALRTGECLAVATSPKSVGLPSRLLRRREQALGRAFATKEGDGCGVVIELAHLWSNVELDASARALKELTP
jgi:hypothetical protein